MDIFLIKNFWHLIYLKCIYNSNFKSISKTNKIILKASVIIDHEKFETQITHDDQNPYNNHHHSPAKSYNNTPMAQNKPYNESNQNTDSKNHADNQNFPPIDQIEVSNTTTKSKSQLKKQSKPNQKFSEQDNMEKLKMLNKDNPYGCYFDPSLAPPPTLGQENLNQNNNSPNSSTYTNNFENEKNTKHLNQIKRVRCNFCLFSIF